MASLPPPATCAWIAPSGGAPCSVPATYTVLLLTAAGAALVVGACARHLGPLVRRSLANPTITHAIVTPLSGSGGGAGPAVEPGAHEHHCGWGLVPAPTTPRWLEARALSDQAAAAEAELRAVLPPALWPLVERYTQLQVDLVLTVIAAMLLEPPA